VLNRSLPASQWFTILALAAAIGLVMAMRSYRLNQPLPNPTSIPLIVDVQGDVYRPGITVLHQSTTVMEAILAAGGAQGRCVTDSVPLPTAEQLHSGQRVRVTCDALSPMQIQLEPMEAGVRLALGEKLDLNQASAEELCLVPGMQPLMATAIVTRGGRQPWVDLRELVEISGVGPRTLGKWENYLEVRGTGTANPLQQPNHPHRGER
jgi:DNA uptake protein ComE-like DNA-binding protein